MAPQTVPHTRHLRLIRTIPWLIPLCAIALMMIGVAGILRGDELAGAGQFGRRQIVWAALAIPVMVATAVVPYGNLRRASYWLFAICLVLLVVVYFCPARNYSHRWIPLGFADLQPSEPAKLAFILTLAQYFRLRRNYRRLPGLVLPFAITVVPVVLILREPDLGTSLLFFPVLFAMLFAAGARLRHLAAIGAVGLLMLPALWSIMSAEQRSRITTVFMQEDGGPMPTGDGYHLHQSKQVLALGGVWGSGLAGMSVSDPRVYHLPAARTDFVFCLVSEQWGLPGVCVAVLLYLMLFGNGLMVAARTQDPFGRLIAVGIVAILGTQLLINTGMTVGLMPITGLTLPLMSYGGSSLVTTCAGIGLLINVGARRELAVTGEPFRFNDHARPRLSLLGGSLSS